MNLKQYCSINSSTNNYVRLDQRTPNLLRISWHVNAVVDHVLTNGSVRLCRSNSPRCNETYVFLIAFHRSRVALVKTVSRLRRLVNLDKTAMQQVFDSAVTPFFSQLLGDKVLLVCICDDPCLSVVDPAPFGSITILVTQLMDLPCGAKAFPELHCMPNSTGNS